MATLFEHIYTLPLATRECCVTMALTDVIFQKRMNFMIHMVLVAPKTEKSNHEYTEINKL